MPSPRTIESYGGIKQNLLDVESAEHEEDAAEANRKAEDLAQMTHLSHFASVYFRSTSDAAPTAVVASNVTVRSHAGNGSSAKPVITKTATGLYTLTWPASYTDALGVVEPIVIAFAKAQLTGTTLGFAHVLGWSNITVDIRLVTTAFADSDFSGNGRVVVDVHF